MASRREAEKWIVDGRVSVNGKIVGIGTRVGSDDTVRVDGRILGVPSQHFRTRVLIYHKPEGEICSKVDDKDRVTVFSRLPPVHKGRWISVGRLDINSSGLLLFTNNGELAHYLMHPSREIVRVYAVRVLGDVTDAIIQILRKGVDLEDGAARFDDIKSVGGSGANRWYEVSLKEGRNREVRRLWESQGIKVSRLTRVQFGPMKLPRRLSRGRWQELTKNEVSDFLTQCAFQETMPSANSIRKHRSKKRRRVVHRNKKP